MTTPRKRFQRWAVKPGTLMVVICLLYVFGQSYRGRESTIDAQRQGCHRGQLDKAVQVQTARHREYHEEELADDPGLSPRARRVYAALALDESVVAAKLGEHLPPVIVCERVYPRASPWPW